MGRHLPSTGTSNLTPTRPTDAAIERQILAKIKQPVHFKYPEGPVDGVLRDRVVIRSNPESKGVPYWDVIDVIDVAGAADSPWIRVGYYRYVKGRLVWGSQTTLTEPLSTWKRLFEKAQSQPSFARLLRA